MDWYFAQDRQRYGPVNEESFALLVAQGRVLADTLVWHEGMASWQPLELAQPGVGASDIASAPDGARGYCSQCHRQLPADDMLPYSALWICGACKDLFFQRLHEGRGVDALPVPGETVFAGFWVRFAGKLLDGLIIGVPLLIMIALFEGPRRHGHSPSFFQTYGGMIIAIAMIGLYNVLMLGRYGATVGKMACAVRVVTADGERLSYARAFLRTAAEWGMLWGWSVIIALVMEEAEEAMTLFLQSLIFIQYVIAGFDRQKRAGHDHIAGTRVIYKRA